MANGHRRRTWASHRTWENQSTALSTDGDGGNDRMNLVMEATGCPSFRTSSARSTTVVDAGTRDEQTERAGDSLLSRGLEHDGKRSIQGIMALQCHSEAPWIQRLCRLLGSQ
eukprot:6646293-Pyramimonas_sp.AAC.1